MLGLRPKLKARPSLLDLIREGGSTKGDSDIDNDDHSGSESDYGIASAPGLQSLVDSTSPGTDRGTGTGAAAVARPGTSESTAAIASGASFVISGPKARAGGTPAAAPGAASATSSPPPAPSPGAPATIKLPLLLRNSPPPSPSPSPSRPSQSSSVPPDRELDDASPLQSPKMPSVCALPLPLCSSFAGTVYRPGTGCSCSSCGEVETKRRG